MHRGLLAPSARTCPVKAYTKIGNKLLRHFHLICSQFEDSNSIKQDTPSPAPVKVGWSGFVVATDAFFRCCLQHAK